MNNILIINLYSCNEKFLKNKNQFKKIFKGNAKLTFIYWKLTKDNKKLKNKIENGYYKGIILSGSDYRIKNKVHSKIPDYILNHNNILGVCYGFQYMIYKLCGLNNIKTFNTKKYQIYKRNFVINKPFKINKIQVRLKHHDYIYKLCKLFKISIIKDNIIYMAYNKNMIGIQFHPEFNLHSGKLFYLKWLNKK